MRPCPTTRHDRPKWRRRPHNGLFAEGRLTLQHGAGVIKFRKVAIKPL
jgi:hypothetical protein